MSSDDKYKIFDSESGRRFTVTTDGVVILERRFSFREVALCLLCCLLGLITLVLFGIVMNGRAVPGAASGNVGPSIAALQGGQAPCKSVHCIMAAANILPHMNLSVDPCQDFYAYACGLVEMDAKESRYWSTTVYSKLRQRNKDKLVKILISDTLREFVEQSAERKLMHLYESCRSQYARVFGGGQPFVDKVLRPFGSAFLLGNKSFTNWNFNEALRKTHTQFWTDVIFEISVRPNPKDPNHAIVEISPGGLSLLPSDYYHTDSFCNETRQHYVKFIKKIGNLVIRDAKVNLTDVNRTEILATFAEDIMTFETKLAGITNSTSPKHAAHPPSLTEKTLGLLNEKAAPVDWVAYFRDLLDDRRIHIGKDTKVISRNWDYIFKAMAMIRELQSEEGDPVARRIINNYFVWRMAKKYASYLSVEYVHAEQIFKTIISSESQYRSNINMVSNSDYCFDLVKKMMPEVLGALFVRNHFADSSLDDIKTIVDRLKATFKTTLRKTSWMDGITRIRAVEKITAMIDKVGYPDYSFRDSELDSMYSFLRIGEYNYFDNILNLHQHIRNESVNYIVHGGDERSKWPFPTYAVHMHLLNSMNELQVPAGILQPPLFHRLLPAYLNYGALGSLIGHKLVKAVDGSGRSWTKTGRYKDWYTNTTEAMFLKKLGCINEYQANITAGGYIPPNSYYTIHIAHIKNHSEFVIAEAGGIRNSLATYRALIKEKGEEPPLPGIDLTSEQAFFVAYAQTNCFTRGSFAAYDLIDEGHLPENLKTNTAVAQLSDFAKTFKCPVGSPMNPSHKCNVF